MSTRTRFTELFATTFSAMRQADVHRRTARTAFKTRIARNRSQTKQPPLSDSMLTAEAEATPDYVADKADRDYESIRADAHMMAAHEATELLRYIADMTRRVAEQNDELIAQGEKRIKQSTLLLTMLEERLPRKVY